MKHLILCAVLFACTASGQLSGLAAIKVPAVYDGSQCQMIARQIAWSLDHQPHQWKTDGYTVTRNGTASVWVANGEDGMAIGPNPDTVSGLGGTWDDDCSKALIWRAFTRWLHRTTGEAP